MKKIKVLLVDDHAVLRDGIRALVKFHDDIEIIGEASKGKEAISLVKKIMPDVIVMDITMPDMNGLEATRRIMKDNAKAKILIFTQHQDKYHVLEAFKAGAVGYIPKTTNGSELISAIRSTYNGGSFLYPSVAMALIEEYRKQAKVDPYDRLTTREREVFRLIAEGYTSQQIAKTLEIALKTVLGHRTKILEKLDIHNTTELIKMAVRKDLISVGA